MATRVTKAQLENENGKLKAEIKQLQKKIDAMTLKAVDLNQRADRLSVDCDQSKDQIKHLQKLLDANQKSKMTTTAVAVVAVLCALGLALL